MGTSGVKHSVQSVFQSVNVLNILWDNQFITNKYNVEGKDSHTWPSVCPMEVKTFLFTAFPAICISVQVRFDSTSGILGCMGLYMPSHMLVSIRTHLYIYVYVRPIYTSAGYYVFSEHF